MSLQSDTNTAVNMEKGHDIIRIDVSSASIDADDKQIFTAEIFDADIGRKSRITRILKNAFGWGIESRGAM